MDPESLRLIREALLRPREAVTIVVEGERSTFARRLACLTRRVKLYIRCSDVLLGSIGNVSESFVLLAGAFQILRTY